MPTSLIQTVSHNVRRNAIATIRVICVQLTDTLFISITFRVDNTTALCIEPVDAAFTNVPWSAVPTGSVADGWLNPLLFIKDNNNNDTNNSNNNNSDLTVLSPNCSGELEAMDCTTTKHLVHTATFRSSNDDIIVAIFMLQ